MAKFRSWNIRTMKFCYWENGRYYTDDKCTEILKPAPSGLLDFSWKNAEQSTVISCSNSDKVECFENDYLEIRYSYNHWAGTLEGTMEETVEGVLKLDEFGFYISNEVLDIYLLELPTIVSVVVKKEERMTLAEKALKNLEKKRSEMSREEFDTYLDENTERAKAKVFGKKEVDNEA